ncbi:MAG TPA: serine hydrolase [Solirubrobacterales bacterium]|nr:serine hydrolase [Solirubrobacterales bacterium]
MSAIAAGAAAVALTGGSGSEPVAAPPDVHASRPPAAAPGGPRGRAREAHERRHTARRAAARRRARVDSAAGYAAGREGRVAFAIVAADGSLHGRDEHELFQSASVVKAMILAAELQRLDDEGERLDPATAAELRRMITVSDNDAATSVFARVGPDRLDAIAHRAGMHDFRSSTTWGASEISAADMAAMFAGLRHLFGDRYEKFALGLLGSIVPEQSWGIPRIASAHGWSVRFKGGWRLDPDGQIVNQAAELRRDGTVEAIAVLTDQQPSMPYGIATIEGIASRLLGGD